MEMYLVARGLSIGENDHLSPRTRMCVKFTFSFPAVCLPLARDTWMDSTRQLPWNEFREISGSGARRSLRGNGAGANAVRPKRASTTIPRRSFMTRLLLSRDRLVQIQQHPGHARPRGERRLI